MDSIRMILVTAQKGIIVAAALLALALGVIGAEDAFADTGWAETSPAKARAQMMASKAALHFASLDNQDQKAQVVRVKSQGTKVQGR
ncbi:hypothetical protein V5T82_05300 [Magnetovibrio sp. PR-2]|uniref:hypothetical protein n=1 Tax=Magnetovibrio sp. PR-2 TaxID=3120356 RepID=UPI002FCE42EB